MLISVGQGGRDLIHNDQLALFHKACFDHEEQLALADRQVAHLHFRVQDHAGFPQDTVCLFRESLPVDNLLSLQITGKKEVFGHSGLLDDLGFLRDDGDAMLLCLDRRERVIFFPVQQDLSAAGRDQA